MIGRDAEPGVDARRADRLELYEPPRPAPLLWPAIAFMGGIWLSETVGALGGLVRWSAVALPLVIGVALVCAGLRRGRVVGLLVLVLGLGVGFVRHQAAACRPSHHIAHVLDDEPILTRLVGEVVTTPVSRPGERRNPFLPFDPPGRTQFVVAVRELHTTDPPTPVCGRVRVAVDRPVGEQPAPQPHLRPGDRVELTGKLYGARGPLNPGAIDWARWAYLQGIDAGLSVDGPRYVRRIDGDGSLLRRILAAARSRAQGLLLEPHAAAGPDHPAEAGTAHEAGQLLNTMVLGQRGAASREINEAFLRAGGMHFLAVSGFHVGVLAGAAWWLTRRLLRRSSVVAAVTMLTVIVAYALLAEPRAPILRATTMGVLASLSILARRPVNSFNWLACACICILAFNPLELFRPGFQLSVVLVFMLLGLVSRVHPFVYRAVVVRLSPVRAIRRLASCLRADRAAGSHRDSGEPLLEANTRLELLVQLPWRWGIGLLSMCFVMWLTALPLVMLHFGRFSPWGWPGSFLLVVPVTVTIWLSFLTLIGKLLLPPAGWLVGAGLQWITGSLLWLVGLFEHLPWAVVEVSSPPPAWLVLAWYAGLLVLVVRGQVWATPRRQDLLPARRARRDFRESCERLFLWSAMVLVFVACVAWPLLPRGGADRGYCFRVLSVGDGSATVVTTPGGRAAVFDAGTDRNLDAGALVARALRALSIRRLESVCVSHANFDHYSGVPTLLAQVPVRRLLLNPYFEGAAADSLAVGRFFELLSAGTEAGRCIAPIEHIRAGDRLAVGELSVEVLWPPSGLDPRVWRANDRSLVLRLHAGGRTVLLPGDIERAAIRGLLDAERAGRIRLAADVLIAPHHGSVLRPETATFLAAVDPELVVVSSATPRPKFAALLHDTLGPGRRLVFTRDVGAMTVRVTRAGEVVVQTQRTPR